MRLPKNTTNSPKHIIKGVKMQHVDLGKKFAAHVSSVISKLAQNLLGIKWSKIKVRANGSGARVPA
jgi:hypothetical protein